MKTRFNGFLTLLLVLVVQVTFAQEKSISGVVSDELGPVADITVLVKGTSKGTVTDFDGKYSIKAKIGDTLVFSHVSYKTDEKLVGASNSINVTLNGAGNVLDEVVVVGYGSQIKRKITDAISSVKAKDIKDVANANFQNALIGKMSGVQITQNNGKAEGRINFTIRGVASITGGQQPLFVVDGIPILNEQVTDGNSAPTNPLINLSSSDIESIQILKDASSAAIYGSRGTNGVVLITTKKGKLGNLNVSLGSSFGISEATHKKGWLNAKEYVELYTESRLNSGVSQAAIDNQLDALATDELGNINDWRNAEVDTDWQDIALGKGSIRETNISVSGATENSNFYLGLANNETEGIVKGNNLERYSFRLNGSKSFLKFKAGGNANIAKSKINRIANDRSFTTPLQAVAQVPISAPYNADGTINRNTIYPNFLAEDKFAFNKTTIWNIGGGAYAEYQFVPSLKFRTDVGYEYLQLIEETFRGPETDFQGSDNGQGSSRIVNREFYNLNNYFTYNKTINENHNLNAVIGMGYEITDKKTSALTGIGFDNPAVTNLEGATTIDSGTTRDSQFNLVSYFSRLSYDYKGKYLLKASMRADGSSKFGPNERYGYFPAASVGWVLSKEAFMENSKLSYLKLRGSWGQTGNQPTRDFRYTNGVNLGEYGGLGTLSLGAAGSPDLKWETTTQTNIGIDFGILKNRISGEIDYYNKDTKDLLLNTPVALVNGIPGNVIYNNVGEMVNKGFEFSLNSKNINTEYLKWSTNFNISFNNNEVVKLAENQEEFISQNQIVRIGETFASWYLVEYAGVDPANGDALYYLNTELSDGTLDRTTTNNFSDAERVILGSPFPDFTYGLTNSLNYKNLDFTFTFQGQSGASIYNSGGRFQEASFAFQDNPSDIELDRWQNPGDITDVPQLRSDGSNAGGNSSRYLNDSDFIRLRNISLGYTFKDLSKGVFDSVRVYATGLNLITITNYNGSDPEATQDDQFSTIARGQEFYSAPPAKVITLGFNINF